MTRLIGAPPVLFEGLALPGEDRHAGLRDRRRGMVLRGEDVAARPANARAEIHQGLDQHGGLNGHVQRTGDADACQRLFLCVLLADGHQTRHLVLGDGDFFAAPIGQRDVGDLVIGSHVGNDSAHSDLLLAD